MIVGFSKYGTGRVQRALKYLLAEEVSKGPIDYLLGEKTRSGVVRNPAPVVLRGDPTLIARLIETSPHRWKYTSGVLSFSAEDTVTSEMERRIMDEFESVAFAGLSPERYAITFIRHAHLGREEIHFLAARQELITGKSLNIAPPGRASRRLFDTWRSKINAEYGFANPDDPVRRASVSLPGYIAKLKSLPGQTRATYTAKVREEITRFVEAKAREGLVKSRADVVRVLQQAGFKLPRQGRDYLTVMHPATGERFRLRGAWYGETITGHVTEGLQPTARPDPGLADQFARQLAPLREARARYHLARYGDSLLSQEAIHDGTRKAPARRAQTTRSAIPVPRSGLCRHAEELEHTTRNLERAIERFGRAHRALAQDYEESLSRARGRRQVKRVLRDYRRAMNQHDAEEEMELDLEL